MRSVKMFFSMALIFLISIPLFATGAQEVTPETTTPMQIVEWLTPFIVLAATYLVRLVFSKIPGWATMIVVTVLSSLVTWATNIDTSEMSYIMQTLYGMLAVFIHQVYKQFSKA